MQSKEIMEASYLLYAALAKARRVALHTVIIIFQYRELMFYSKGTLVFNLLLNIH